MEKRRKGRPRKKEDSIEFWQFARAGIVMSAYDEARKRGEKHSVAVREAVDFIRQGSLGMPISDTEVKRIISTFRPRGSGIILCFEHKILTDENVIKRHHFDLEQLTALQEKRGLRSEVPTNQKLTRSIVSLTGSFAERPNYPRHNRKIR